MVDIPPNQTKALLYFFVKLHRTVHGPVLYLGMFGFEKISVEGEVFMAGLYGHIIVSEFKFQSCYYVHFWTNTLCNGMNPQISPPVTSILMLSCSFKTRRSCTPPLMLGRQLIAVLYLT